MMNDRQGEDAQRPEGVSGDRHERRDRVERGDDDADPAAKPAAGGKREGRDELDHANDEDDPAPSVQPAEDVFLVGDEEGRITDRGDAPDDVQDAGDAEKNRSEQPRPCGSVDVADHHELLLRECDQGCRASAAGVAHDFHAGREVLALPRRSIDPVMRS